MTKTIKRGDKNRAPKALAKCERLAQ